MGEVEALEVTSSWTLVAFYQEKSRRAAFDMKSLELWSFAALAFPCWAVTRPWCHSTPRICSYVLYTPVKPQVCKSPLVYAVGNAVTMNLPNGLLSATKGVRVQDEIGLRLILDFLSSGHKKKPCSITLSIHGMVIRLLG